MLYIVPTLVTPGRSRIGGRFIHRLNPSLTCRGIFLGVFCMSSKEGALKGPCPWSMSEESAKLDRTGKERLSG